MACSLKGHGFKSGLSAQMIDNQIKDTDLH
jgi:hypothetical protein